MADTRQAQLLGYLVGALDEAEREAVQRQLHRNRQMQEDLRRLRRVLHCLEPARQEYAPPPGLAARTCEAVFRAAQESPADLAAAPSPMPVVPAAAPTVMPPVGRGSPWTWLDVLAAAAVMVVATMLVVPAIQQTRFNARVAQCQENLRRLHLALAQYSARHNEYFPAVAPRGRLASAGVYAPLLVSQGFLEDGRYVVCPGSDLAADRDFRVPRWEEVLTATAERWQRLRTTMGGSYGYCLGHVEDGRYRCTRNLRRPAFALVADAPSSRLPGYQSLNHAGRGQNVLFEDGRVTFVTMPRLYEQADDFFVNDTGLVAPGMHRDDAVIGSSATAPVLP